MIQAQINFFDEIVVDGFCGGGGWSIGAEIAMGSPISWAPGLPLKAEGWVGDYFTKD